MKKNIFIFCIFCCFYMRAQVGIGTASPSSASVLDLKSTSKGLLLPRMSTSQRDGINSPEAGLFIYNTTTNCMEWYTGSFWFNNGCNTGVSKLVDTGYCAGSALNGSYVSNVPVSGATYTVTLTNVSGAVTRTLPAPVVGDLALSGVGGISVASVSLSAPFTIAAGATQIITYTLSGTPSSIGTLNAVWNYGDLSCTKTKSVVLGDANFTLPQTSFVLSVLDVSSGTNVQGVVDNGTNMKTISLPYTGGVGTYSAYTSAWIPSGSGMGQSGDSNSFQISYPAGSFSSTGNILVTYVVDGDLSFNAKKEPFGVQETIATLPFSVNDVSKGNLLLNVIGGIPDRNFTQQTTQGGNPGMYHNNVYWPIISSTGKTWLNNNLGSDYSDMTNPSYSPLKQATSSTDYHAYGSLYQWGRYSDGHELINWSSSTAGASVNGNTATLSSTDTPGNNLYIGSTVGNFDWRSPKNDSLWQGGSGANNPCPLGFRVPTSAEFLDELTAYSISNIATAHASVHKLVLSGDRDRLNNTLNNVSIISYLWSSTVGTGSSNLSKYLGITSIGASFTEDARSYGMPIRCIKN